MLTILLVYFMICTIGALADLWKEIFGDASGSIEKKGETIVVTKNIILLGGRRSGKSTILASALHIMEEELSKKSKIQQLPINGDYKSLWEKSEELKKYIENKGDYSTDMTPNTVFCKYSLSWQEDQMEFIFNFTDVPGEAMSATSFHQEQVAEFIKTGDVFIVAIDTPYLMEGNDFESEIANKSGEIFHLLRENIDFTNAKNAEKMVILCPVKCEKWYEEGKIEDVSNKVESTYKMLINMSLKKSKLQIHIAPVLTAGGISFKEMSNGKVVWDDIKVRVATFTNNGKGYQPKYCDQLIWHILNFMLERFRSSGNVIIKEAVKDMQKQMADKYKTTGDGYKIIKLDKEA